MDEPLYVQGVQLKKQGRNSEALDAFLKVIEKRGLRESAESHLEVGALYLNHTKDPIRAIFHFQEYLELQPNSKQAVYVRGMIDAARREFAKSLLLGLNTDDQSNRAALNEDVDKLRRENSELRAEIQVLRGGGAAYASRTPRVVTLPQDLRTQPAAPPPTAPIIDSPMTVAPPVAAARPPISAPSILAPAARAATTTTPPRPITAAPANTRGGSPATAATPSRPSTSAGKTHTVQPKESLYSIAKRYNVKLEDLARANGIGDPSKVPAGTVLRIP
jgi:LysM repeat protein